MGGQIMDNIAQAKLIANHLISLAKQWGELKDKSEKNETVAEFNPTSGLYNYVPANPAKIAFEIKKQINDLGTELQTAVLTEISEISKEADKGIEANGGRYDCDAGVTKLACYLIEDFYKMCQDTPTA